MNIIVEKGPPTNLVGESLCFSHDFLIYGFSVLILCSVSLDLEFLNRKCFSFWWFEIMLCPQSKQWFNKMYIKWATFMVLGSALFFPKQMDSCHHVRSHCKRQLACPLFYICYQTVLRNTTFEIHDYATPTSCCSATMLLHSYTSPPLRPS